jgi:hypothetical protein
MTGAKIRLHFLGTVAGCCLILAGLALAAGHPHRLPQEVRNFPRSVSSGERTLSLIAPGNSSWTDTGIEVASGEEIIFKVEGTISLQKGNPEAECGPDGYDIRTFQQPLPAKNMGALIGKIVISLTVTVDEKTNEEKQEEVAEIFYIGSVGRVEMPVKGRLFLGINENVVGDNTGEFRVTLMRGD